MTIYQVLFSGQFAMDCNESSKAAPSSLHWESLRSFEPRTLRVADSPNPCWCSFECIWPLIPGQCPTFESKSQCNAKKVYFFGNKRLCLQRRNFSEEDARVKCCFWERCLLCLRFVFCLLKSLGFRFLLRSKDWFNAYFFTWFFRFQIVSLDFIQLDEGLLLDFLVECF